ncbi:MAG TPA: ABC transporter permease subunit [Planctomycetota bacterium]|nr:ABC transporter permease subunit [Planctomycetota bacterium]
MSELSTATNLPPSPQAPLASVKRVEQLASTLKIAQQKDRAGKWAISFAALLVLSGVAMILFFLVAESLPLIFEPEKHPGGTLEKMFLPQKYKGYAEPQYVWQTEASEGGEEKFGVPLLIWGTLKGAFWAMFFSAPLAIMTALFVAEFAKSQLRTVIKSAIELLAGVPTVVIGFIAFVTLSPIFNDYFQSNTAYFRNGLWIGILIQILVFTIVSAGLGARILISRRSAGVKAFGIAGVLMLGVLAGLLTGRVLDWTAAPLFRPLFGVTKYTQLNGILAGFCLGFAIIPIIFSVAEDAMRAVPHSYREASLALGASPWETALRVILPAALPGIYAALMLGLARAVGETMIILMASGNTPIFEVSPFTGMRTMSAAIAIEASEKARFSTGYHVLFFVGTLLFFMTLVLNVATEQVITRLKKRYHVG